MRKSLDLGIFLGFLFFRISSIVVVEESEGLLLFFIRIIICWVLELFFSKVRVVRILLVCVDIRNSFGVVDCGNSE